MYLYIKENTGKPGQILGQKGFPYGRSCRVAPAWGTPPGHTALLASIAIAAVRGGSCPAACHASRHASIVPHPVAELLAPLENGASKFNNASRVISSMSIPVPPLPASSAATSAFCATSTTRSILFCCACKACLTKRVARTKNRVPGVARYY